MSERQEYLTPQEWMDAKIETLGLTSVESMAFKMVCSQLLGANPPDYVLDSFGCLIDSLAKWKGKK